MNDPKSTAHQQALARQRAQLIMQVRSGVLSAQEAARQLGVSRKTYYKWERRALAAMVEALGDRELIGNRAVRRGRSTRRRKLSSVRPRSYRRSWKSWSRRSGSGSS